jgi:hypothetical protein
MYRSMFSRPRQWLQVKGQLHVSATLSPGENLRFQFDRRLGEPQGRRGEEKTLATIGTRTQILGSAASRYTDCARAMLN